MERIDASKIHPAATCSKGIMTDDYVCLSSRFDEIEANAVMARKSL